jgi:hypothetical protein
MLKVEDMEENEGKEENETLLPVAHHSDSHIEANKKFNVSIKRFLIVCSLTTAVFVGFLLGRLQKGGDASYGLPGNNVFFKTILLLTTAVPPGPIQTQWQHNLTFTRKPDAESEAAWSSIIPTGRGFIHHPQLAPFVSNIAVFHQLHCLVSISILSYP